MLVNIQVIVHDFRINIFNCIHTVVPSIVKKRHHNSRERSKANLILFTSSSFLSQALEDAATAYFSYFALTTIDINKGSQYQKENHNASIHVSIECTVFFNKAKSIDFRNFKIGFLLMVVVSFSAF